MKRTTTYLALMMLAVVGMLLAACGGAAAPAAAPTTAPAAKAAAPTEAPKAAAPTAAPAAKATEAPKAAAATAAPAAKATEAPKAAAAPSFKGAPIKLWHGWTGAEADTLATVVKAFETANPGAKVELLAVPFDQLKNKFTTEASTGGGPDLLIGPKDWIGELSQAKLISSLDDFSAQAGFANLNKAALDANKFGGKTWAFPESTEAIAMYYNTDKVKTAPTSADDLLKAAEASGMGLNTQFYNSVGFILGNGAKLLDASGKCVLDQGPGGAQALDWLKKAKGTTNVIADTDGGKLSAAFKDGRVGIIYDGPWAAGDYAKALGDKVAVGPAITLPNGKFAPFLGTKNVFLSTNSKSDAQGTALGFMNFLSQPAQQEAFAKIGHIPSNPNAKADSKVTQGFLQQMQSTSYFPNEPEMGAVWTPAGDAITRVLEGKADGATALKDACAAINAANKK